MDRIDTLHNDLEAGVASLIESDNWQNWLKTAARFHKYSFNNTMLIMLQMPNATQVCGYRKWQEMGRQVNKGSKSISILAPSTRKVKDSITGVEERRVIGFRAVAVFDVSQTTGDELPVQPTPELLQGEAPAGLFDAIAAQIAANGFALEFGDTGNANGYMSPDTRTIRISDSLSDSQTAKTAIHELTHAILHSSVDYDYHGHRGTAEIEAESTAFLVSAAFGMPTDAYSMPYVAGWSEDSKMIAATADSVLKTSRQIIAAITATSDLVPVA